MERIKHLYWALLVFLMPLFSCTQKMASGTTNSAMPIHKDVAGEEVAANHVNGRILRQFFVDFGDMPDAKWFKSANGFRVTFRVKDVLTRVYYRNGGVQECAIRYYFEDKLDRDVRHRVKSAYYDFNITHVTEVQMSGTTAYHIKLESMNEIRTVKVSQDGMEQVEKLLKR